MTEPGRSSLASRRSVQADMLKRGGKDARMAPPLLPKATLAALLVGAVTYWSLTLYSQPLASSRQAAPIGDFLEHALAQDTAGLLARSARAQPVEWALAAFREDSAALREWVESRPMISTQTRGDTLWVTLRRTTSTHRCPFLSPLEARLVLDPPEPRLVRLSSSCPALDPDDTRGEGGSR